MRKLLLVVVVGWWLWCVCVGRGSSREDESKFLIPRAKDRGRRVYFLDKR